MVHYMNNAVDSALEEEMEGARRATGISSSSAGEMLAYSGTPYDPDDSVQSVKTG